MNMHIQALSKAKRILLTEKLWDSVASENDLFPLTNSEKELLDSRLNNYRLDNESGASWDEIKSRITAK